MACPRPPCCSLEKEYSLREHTTWYGRQPSMTWMWSPAGSTRPSAAKTEIFGGHSLLRLFQKLIFNLFILCGAAGKGVHIPRWHQRTWVLQIKLKSSGLALPTGSFFWPPLLRLWGHIPSCSSVPMFVLLSGPLTLFEATKCHALPERVALGWSRGSPRMG